MAFLEIVDPPKPRLTPKREIQIQSDYQASRRSLLLESFVHWQWWNDTNVFAGKVLAPLYFFRGLTTLPVCAIASARSVPEGRVTRDRNL